MAKSMRTVLAGSAVLLAALLILPGAPRAEIDPVPVAMAVDPASLELPRPTDVAWAAADAAWDDVFGKPADAPLAQPASFTPAPELVRPAALTIPMAAKPSAAYRVHLNEHVRFFLERFQTGYRRAVVESWLTRSGRYLPMILDVFQQKGLPEELVFTAMIESGFNPVAVSHAGAKGLWQFMAPTARLYGLRVDRWLDERLDPEKSTVAAANYLRDLYTVFGSWDLAQAAYNAGEFRVQRAIQGTGSRDFWRIRRSPILLEETKNFVPAIHAATLISRQPERYGFTVIPDEPLRYEQVTVPKGTRLARLAGLSRISPQDLEALNPELRQKQTPPDAPYELKVPLGASASVLMALELDAAPRIVAPAPATGVHVVKSGDTVWRIARQYGVSPSQLVRWNGLDRPDRIFPGERLRVALPTITS
jgi:membrane-bound lytic murein transglycosylase D